MNKNAINQIYEMLIGQAQEMNKFQHETKFKTNLSKKIK